MMKMMKMCRFERYGCYGSVTDRRGHPQRREFLLSQGILLFVTDVTDEFF